MDRILEERTALLAAPHRHAAPPAPHARLLACGCGVEIHGIPLETVAEILPVRRCVRVPGAASPVIGASGWLGRLWAVVDLGAALGLAEAPPPEDLTGHLLRLRDQPRPVLLRVERVLGVVDADRADDAAPEAVPRGVVVGQALAPAGSLAAAPRLIGVLDPGRLLHPLVHPVPNGA